MLRGAVLAAAARYPSTAPDVLLPVVDEQIWRLRDAIEATTSARTLRQLVQLMGVCAGIAGNLHNDLADPVRANEYFAIGRRAGHEADDPALTAWVLVTESIGPLHTSRPREAAALADQAFSLVSGTGNARREAWVLAMAARAHAALGEQGPALDALTRSRAALEAAAEPTGDMDFFDAARLDGISGTVHLHLGNTAESIRHLTAAVGRRDRADAKGRALLVFDLAECAVQSGEPDHAADLAHRALDTAAGQYVRPIIDRARTLHTQLAAFPQLGQRAGYSERLRALATPAPPRQKERPA